MSGRAPPLPGPAWRSWRPRSLASSSTASSSGLMPVASLSVSKGLLGEAFTPTLGGDWFARFTAALMLGAAVGGIALGNLGDRIGRDAGHGGEHPLLLALRRPRARGRRRRSRCSSCGSSSGWAWAGCGPTASPWSPSAGRTPRARWSPA